MPRKSKNIQTLILFYKFKNEAMENTFCNCNELHVILFRNNREPVSDKISYSI